MHDGGYKNTKSLVNQSPLLYQISNKKFVRLSDFSNLTAENWSCSVLHIYTFVPARCSVCCWWLIDNSLKGLWLRKRWIYAFKKGKKRGEDIQRGELQLLKNPAKEEERAVNVEEIRLPWKLWEYKENLLARGTGLASSCHSTWPNVPEVWEEWRRMKGWFEESWMMNLVKKRRSADGFELIMKGTSTLYCYIHH